MAQVFISYAKENRDLAEVVQAKLMQAGHGTSMDIDVLRAGDAWQAKLDQRERARQGPGSPGRVRPCRLEHVDPHPGAEPIE